MNSRRWVVTAGTLLFAGIIALVWWTQRGAGSATVSPVRSGDRGGEVAPPDERVSLSDPARDVESSSLVDSASSSARTEITTSRELRVRVVDSARHPLANVPVALAGIGEREQHGGVVVRTQAPDGIARFVAPDESSRLESADTDWCVYLPFPGAGAEFVRVARANPPVEPIELVAPDLGRLVVKIEDASGQPLETHGEVQILCWYAGTKPSPDMRSSTFPFRFPFTGGAELVVDPIATGQRLDLEVWLEKYAVGSVRGDGPRRAGETATVSAVMRRYGPIVIGRLVGTDGAPVAGTPFSGFIVGDSGVGRHDIGVELTTDAAGRFRFDASWYDGEGHVGPRQLELQRGRATAGMVGRARVALPAVFIAGEYDVGQVAYEAAPLVVSGRVVDPHGSAVAGALVHVCRSISATNQGLLATGSGDVMFTAVDASGAFEMYGFEEGEFIVFAADEAQRESVPVHFTSGRRDVSLMLRGWGGLEGSFVNNAVRDMDQIGLFVKRADHDEADDGSPYARVSSTHGRFLWRRLAAGRIDVVIALGRGEHTETVLVVPGVEVTAGAVNRPEALAGIDLRAHLTTVEIEVVDPDGASVPHGTVALLSSDDGHEAVLTTPLVAGKAQLLAARKMVDVDVRAAGFLRERRLGVSSGARIELGRAIPVRVALDPPFEPEKSAIAIDLVLTAVGRADSGADQQRIALDAHGNAVFSSSESGRFQVALETRVTARPSETPNHDVTRFDRLKATQQRLAAAFGRPLIEIHEATGEQRLPIPLPPAARTILSEMLRDFGEAPK